MQQQSVDYLTGDDSYHNYLYREFEREAFNPKVIISFLT